MEIIIKLNISKPVDSGERLICQPQLTEEEMEKAHEVAKGLKMDLVAFLINLNIVVKETFDMALEQSEYLTFDSLLDTVKGFIEEGKK